MRWRCPPLISCDIGAVSIGLFVKQFTYQDFRVGPKLHRDQNFRGEESYFDIRLAILRQLYLFQCLE